MEIKETIHNFLDEYGYTNDKNLEGVILYGSYQTKTNKKDSDVDLIIIYSSEVEMDAMKEYKQYKNYNFELLL